MRQQLVESNELKVSARAHFWDGLRLLYDPDVRNARLTTGSNDSRQAPSVRQSRDRTEAAQFKLLDPERQYITSVILTGAVVDRGWYLKYSQTVDSAKLKRKADSMTQAVMDGRPQNRSVGGGHHTGR